MLQAGIYYGDNITLHFTRDLQTVGIPQCDAHRHARPNGSAKARNLEATLNLVEDPDLATVCGPRYTVSVVMNQHALVLGVPPQLRAHALDLRGKRRDGHRNSMLTLSFRPPYTENCIPGPLILVKRCLRHTRSTVIRVGEAMHCYVVLKRGGNIANTSAFVQIGSIQNVPFGQHLFQSMAVIALFPNVRSVRQNDILSVSYRPVSAQI